MSDLAIPDLGLEIVRMTDETLDRIGPRLDYLAQNPERMYPSGSVSLDVDNDTLITDDETRHAKIVVCNFASKLALNDMAIDLFPGLMEPFVHGERDVTEDEGYDLVGLDVGFRVLRARFPQGHPNFGWTTIPSPNDPAEYNPDVTGLRHAVGAEITTYFEKKEDGDVVTFTVGTQVQKRFDAPEPQHKTTAETRRRGTSQHRDEEYREPATEEHVARIAGFLAIAKDIRPAIQPIARYRRQRAAIDEIIGSFFAREEAA
ncbi:MAG: hypothetical protein ACXWLH_03100 [Candidatus Saccharimonadales bacterium]